MIFLWTNSSFLMIWLFKDKARRKTTIFSGIFTFSIDKFWLFFFSRRFFERFFFLLCLKSTFTNIIISERGPLLLGTKVCLSTQPLWESGSQDFSMANTLASYLCGIETNTFSTSFCSEKGLLIFHNNLLWTLSCAFWSTQSPFSR